MKRVAIIGGGIAGVTAAFELAADAGQSIQAVLLEASNRLGGIVETVREGGFTIECGPDGWVTEKPWARELATELDLGDDLLPSNDATRKTYVLTDGKLQAMPDGMRMMVPSSLAALDHTELFSEAAKQAFRDEPARAEELRASAPKEDESVASFVRRHFGDEVLEKIGAPLLSGVLGGNVESLSVRAVMAPFIAMEREHGSLITALSASTRTSSVASIFTTLRSGLGSLVDRMVASIPPSWIRLNTPVLALERDHRGWLLTTARGVEHFDSVLLATPAHIASALLAPVDARASELMRMDASSAVVATFGFADASHMKLPPGFGFLVPPNQNPDRKLGNLLLACTFMDQKFDDRVPPGGRLIRAFFGSEAARRLMRCGNDEIATIARMELAHILGPLPEPQIVVVRRWPASLPQYAVGHLERMRVLDQRIRDIGELSLLGNGYRGVGLPDLIRDARAAARQVTAPTPAH